MSRADLGISGRIAAAGLEHPCELGPEHVIRRISSTEVRSLAALHVWAKPGELRDGTPEHPVFSCFYKLDAYPQIPGLGSFFAGRTWEKGGVTAHLRTILDDHGRPMLMINWNTDMGDGWEWSNAEEYPGYLKWTAVAYQMMINEIVYTLTH